VLVRRPADLAKLAGIVLPGGESTTMSMLLDSSGLFGPLGDALASGLPAFGTCAGLILVARTVVDGRPGQRTFGCIDLVVRRNGYGRQAQSFECDLSVSGLDDGDPGETGIGEHRPDGRIVTGGEVADRAMHAVFIRAPVVESVGPGRRSPGLGGRTRTGRPSRRRRPRFRGGRSGGIPRRPNHRCGVPPGVGAGQCLSSRAHRRSPVAPPLRGYGGAVHGRGHRRCPGRGDQRCDSRTGETGPGGSDGSGSGDNRRWQSLTMLARPQRWPA
jgi:glutamine amidotransferase PdxT